MISERFYMFSLLIDSIHKNINRIKCDFVPRFGVKSVHMFWFYELQSHPDGLTSAELAAKSMISRSLVSREIEWLRANGYIVMQESARGKRKNYNSRITLTEKGLQLAQQIRKEAIEVQERARAGIGEEELAAFYRTLRKLRSNLQEINVDLDPSVSCEEDEITAMLPSTPSNNQ